MIEKSMDSGGYNDVPLPDREHIFRWFPWSKERIKFYVYYWPDHPRYVPGQPKERLGQIIDKKDFDLALDLARKRYAKPELRFDPRNRRKL